MTAEQWSAVSVAEEDNPSCQHHWVIQDDLGPSSRGICRVCGEVKKFKNYLGTSHWGDENPKGESRVSLLGKAAQIRMIPEDENDF